MTGVAVVGTGFGCYTHVRALRASGFDVRALVGRSPAKTAERARLFEVPRALTSLEGALAVPGVEAVTIATPPGTHAALALAAIAAGRHVICEKPFTATLAEARTVLAAAEGAGVVHLLGTEFRWDPGQAGLAHAVRHGEIGEPRLATWLMHVPVLADPDAVVPDWWADAGSSGGWMWAHGSQLIDQIRVTLGEFDGVSAQLVHVADRPAMSADDGFVVHFRMRNGTVGVMQSTAADWGVLVETRVTGSRGAAWIEGVGAKVKVAGPDGVRTRPVPEGTGAEPAPALPEGAVRTTYERMITFGVEYGPYTRLTAAFRDLIAGKDVAGPAPATFADGVAQMAVLEAIMASASGGGRWTAVETTEPTTASTTSASPGAR
jgi:predicted dehydrogenase